MSHCYCFVFVVVDFVVVDFVFVVVDFVVVDFVFVVEDFVVVDFVVFSYLAKANSIHAGRVLDDLHRLYSHIHPLGGKTLLSVYLIEAKAIFELTNSFYFGFK